ncbi:MAG TPA: hypothetical protein PKC21_10215 [Oligoflexia bacterium]|nr:hypothetical protein [Oligoflexia bacterium]HMR25714.1 hypothetical protein [Oligoflexia bacterium]
MTQLQKEVFIGRESFISDFVLTLEQIKEDQGQILSIEGPVGIGSSTLLKHYESIIQQKKCLSIKSHLSPDTLDPLQCFRDWAPQLISLCTTHSIQISKTEQNILQALNIPEIHSTLPYEGNEFDQAVIYTFKQIIERFNQDHLVFIIEDLTFAPNTSIEYLGTVFENFENNKTLLLYTQVPKHVLPWHKDLNYNEQKLPAFTHDEVHQFCTLHLKADYIASSVINTLHESSKGNPLYLEKLLEHALKQKYIQYIENNDRRSIILKKDIGSIPKDLSELLLARFHSLPKLEQQLLLHCSIFGYEDNADHLKAYFEHEFEQDVQTNFNILFNENFLDVTSNFPHYKYRFNHALLYDTLLKQLSQKQKIEIHTKITEFLDDYKNQIELDDLTYKIAGHAQKGSNIHLKTQYSYLAGVKSYQNNQFQLSVQHFKHLSGFIDNLSLEQLETYIIYKTKALIATESLEHANNFIASVRQKINFDKPIFDYLEAEISHHQNQYQKVIDKTENLSVQDIWAQSIFPDLLPMRLKSLLNDGKQNTSIHESFKTLRYLLNNNIDKELQTNIWGKVLLANIYSRKTSCSPYLVRLINTFDHNKFTIKSQIEINSNIVRWLQSSKMNKEAIYYLSKNIQLCDKYYLINTKNQMNLYKGVAYSILGEFENALSHYKNASDSFLKLNNLRQSYNAFLFYIDCLLDQGALILAQKEIKKLTLFKKINKSNMNLGIENVLLGIYYFCKKDYPVASQYFLDSSNYYKKANLNRAVFNFKLRSLIMKTQFKKIDHNYIKNEYILAYKTLQKDVFTINSIIHLHLAYYYIQSIGIEIVPPTEKINLRSISDVYLKQWYYIAKINYLKSQNNLQEAQELIDEYQKIRDEILINVPDQFKQDFINHPIFKVPSLN